MEETKNESTVEQTEIKTEAKEKKPKGKEKELLSKIEELEAIAKEKDDKYLRLAAEYDNFRRRSKEEKDATYENAMSDTVAQLLPMITTKPFIERPKQFYQIRGCNTIQFRVMRKVSLYLEF